MTEAVKRELQLNEGAHVAGYLNLAGGQGIPGLEVPQLQRDDGAGSPSGEPEPAPGFADIGVQADKQLKRPGQSRRRRRVPLCHPQRDRVEQDVDRARRVGAGRRSPCGLGRLPHTAGPAEMAGEHRGPERLQVRLAGRGGVERLSKPGRAQQQPGGVATAAPVEGDLPAQELHLHGLACVQRPGFGRDQQPQRRV